MQITASSENKTPAVYSFSQTSCTIVHVLLRLEQEKILEGLVLGIRQALS